jgi:exodeoxyribonuclease VII large subunit
MEDKYTLYELNEHIRRVIALNLPDAMWISCEIAQISISKGHAFIHLVQKEEEGESIVAQSEAVIWAMDYRRLKRKFGTELNSLLQEGMEVMIQAKVDFNERYGFKLIILDLDPAYTIGKLALQRQKVIEVLKKEELFKKNVLIPLPAVIQRIAVLSSEKAAGFQDYLDQINQNQFGYSFENHLFPTSMQGDKVESEMIAQLKHIELQKDDFDCVIIIRGGGARLDLAAFDGLKLSKAIANCSLPVITGIGHDIDETVVDLVAHTSLKTPTAVAEFIVQFNLKFEMRLSELGMTIQQLAQQKLTNQEFTINRLENQFKFSINLLLKGQTRMLEFVEEKIPALLKAKLRTEKSNILNFEKICQLLSPENTLKRGFSLSLLDGKVISSSKHAKEGDLLETVFSDGKIKSKILSNG